VCLFYQQKLFETKLDKAGQSWTKLVKGGQSWTKVPSISLLFKPALKLSFPRRRESSPETALEERQIGQYLL